MHKGRRIYLDDPDRMVFLVRQVQIVQSELALTATANPLLASMFRIAGEHFANGRS